jgi:guanosine-3',5'-bis(diphosphate) 3'-pyrophosphohydrolase
MSLLDKATAFAEKAHEGQFRKGGHGIPYVTHPKNVAATLAAHGVDDQVVLAAALLHDVVEDCGVTEEEMVAEFGSEVASVVMEVSDAPGSKTKAKKAQIEKAPTMSHRAKLVKLADKLDNVDSLVKSPPGWKPESVKGYVESATMVVRAMGPVNHDLEVAFFVAAGKALASVA